MKIKESNQYKTTFYTKYSYFKYPVIFFGLFNTIVNFQSSINKILAKKLDIFIIIYLGDIFIYIKNLSQSYIKTI